MKNILLSTLLGLSLCANSVPSMASSGSDTSFRDKVTSSWHYDSRFSEYIYDVYNGSDQDIYLMFAGLSGEHIKKGEHAFIVKVTKYAFCIEGELPMDEHGHLFDETSKTYTCIKKTT